MNLLLIEDHKDIAAVIFEYFEIKAYELDYANNGVQGYDLACQNHYDLIILDIMLPRMNGLSVCQKLREQGITTPIIMLTARDTREDMLVGFDQGADDYLVKPFDLEILEARITALCRRQKGMIATKKLEFEELTLHINNHTVERNGCRFPLNPTLFNLLKILMLRAPEVVSKDEISALIWQENEPEKDILRSHVYQLRSLIDKPFNHAYIKTVPKLGYQLISSAN